jgi:hypothetical protein
MRSPPISMPVACPISIGCENGSHQNAGSIPNVVVEPAPLSVYDELVTVGIPAPIVDVAA